MAIHLYSNVWIIFLELVMSGSGYQPITKFFKKLTPAEIARNESIKKGKEMIKELVLGLYTIARMLNPLMPETNITLKKLIRENKKPEKPLFLRKE